MKKMLCLGIILLSPLHLVGSEQPGSQEGAQTRPSLPLSNKAARKYRQQHGISPKSAPKKVIKVVSGQPQQPSYAAVVSGQSGSMDQKPQDVRNMTLATAAALGNLSLTGQSTAQPSSQSSELLRMLTLDGSDHSAPVSPLTELTSTAVSPDDEFLPFVGAKVKMPERRSSFAVVASETSGEEITGATVDKVKQRAEDLAAQRADLTTASMAENLQSAPASAATAQPAVKRYWMLGIIPTPWSY